MRMSRLAAPVLALAVALPVYAVAAPASAPDRPTRVERQDGRGDVWRIVERTGRPKPVRTERVPGRRVGDVKVVRVLHTRSAVVVRLRLAKLDRSLLPVGIPVVQLRMPASHVTALGVVNRQGEGGVLALTTYGGDALDCPDAAIRLRPKRRAVEFRLPRTCLGDPSVVRARVVGLSFDRRDLQQVDTRRQTTYVDVVPGRGLRLRDALLRRAFAPVGASVVDGPPPIDDSFRAVPSRLDGVLDTLRSLGLR